MVQGLAEFNRRWTAIPRLVRQAAIETLEANAEELVSSMRPLLPLADTSDRGLLITVYARADDFNPAWFEFGTAPRFTKAGKYSGQIIASPFFWPTYRAKKKRLKSRMTRSITKAIKKA